MWQNSDYFSVEPLCSKWLNKQAEIIAVIRHHHHHHHHRQRAIFEPQPSSENSCRFYSVFTSLDFAPMIFLQSKVISFESNPQPGGPGPHIYVPQ
jgi:hypothetical protein